ncbi:MAG: hypothetical protein AAAFM81_04510 [Pseudomonadota bacterium]
MFRPVLLPSVLALLTACAHEPLLDRSGPGLYELVSEQYIRGPNDTIGSAGPAARGTTVCTYVNRKDGAREMRRHPGGMPCPATL